jgi:dipeptide/tripeptide permease
MDEQYHWTPATWVVFALVLMIAGLGYALETWRRERKRAGRGR